MILLDFFIKQNIIYMLPFLFKATYSYKYYCSKLHLEDRVKLSNSYILWWREYSLTSNKNFRDNCFIWPYSKA